MDCTEEEAYTFAALQFQVKLASQAKPSSSKTVATAATDDNVTDIDAALNTLQVCATEWSVLCVYVCVCVCVYWMFVPVLYCFHLGWFCLVISCQQMSLSYMYMYIHVYWVILGLLVKIHTWYSYFLFLGATGASRNLCGKLFVVSVYNDIFELYNVYAESERW